jgi:hypothetical protein
MSQHELRVGTAVPRSKARCSSKTNAPYQPVHYDIAPNYFEAFWLERIGRLGGATLWKLVTVAAASLSTLIILGVMDEAGSPENVASLSRIAPYGLIGTAAYVIVFTLAAGYIHTVYQVHNAPFAVYLSALLDAGAIYVLCSLATANRRVRRMRPIAPISQQCATSALLIEPAGSLYSICVWRRYFDPVAGGCVAAEQTSTKRSPE